MSEDPREVVRRGYDALGEAYHEERTGGTGDERLVDRFADRLPDGARTLDAGCGAGVPATERLAAAGEAVGLDISREQLRLAREHVPGAVFAQGDLGRLPFADDAFDGLLALYSVIHVPRGDHGAVFAEFRRVLRPGAPALITVGDGAWAGENDDWLGEGVRMRWSFHGAERSRGLLRSAGFSVVEDGTVDDDIGGGEFAVLLARA